MSLIDWSDPDTMLGLLIEFVADEALVVQNDGDRADFLRQLSRDLLAAAEHEFQSADEIAEALREIHNAQPRDFASDPVLAHVAACIEELTRIAGEPQSVH